MFLVQLTILIHTHTHNTDTHTQTHTYIHLASSRGLVVKSEWTICPGVDAKVIRDSLKKNYTTFCGAITRCKNAQGRGLIVRLGSSCEMLDAWQMQWAVQGRLELCRSLWSWFLVIKCVRCNFGPLLCNVQLFCRLCRMLLLKASAVGKVKALALCSFDSN